MQRRRALPWITAVIHVWRVRSVASLRPIPCNRWQSAGSSSAAEAVLPVVYRYFITISSWGLNAAGRGSVQLLELRRPNPHQTGITGYLSLSSDGGAGAASSAAVASGRSAFGRGGQTR